MRRGEIWLAELDPTVGAEAKKTRPVVIVARDASNRVVERNRYGVITVVPLTSNTSRVLDFQALIPADGANGLGVDSKAQAEQLRSLDFGRFVKRVGILGAEQLSAVEDAVIAHLGLF